MNERICTMCDVVIVALTHWMVQTGATCHHICHDSHESQSRSATPRTAHLHDQASSSRSIVLPLRNMTRMAFSQIQGNVGCTHRQRPVPYWRHVCGENVNVLGSKVVCTANRALTTSHGPPEVSALRTSACAAFGACDQCRVHLVHL